MNRYAIIMAGGAGERFWPLSRIKRPKHLWNIAGGKKCLLSQTFARISKIVGKNNVFVVTNAEQVEGIKKYCPEISAKNIVAESCGRDTCAAIALSASIVERAAGGKEAAFAVFPSDHVISDTKAFANTIKNAFEVAESGNNLVAIGIEPTFPATGFGYVEHGEKIELSSKSGSFDFFEIKRFREKPDLKTAKKFLKTGNFFWNGGMFVWKTSSIFSALEKYAPDTFSIFLKLRDAAKRGEKTFAAALKKEYPKIEKISIDFAVMEKADNAYVVPSSFDWDDVGSWNAIERHFKTGEAGIVAEGEVFSLNSKNCVVFDAAGRATALVGVEDLVVVQAKDATLICKKEYAESLKNLVKTLPSKYR